MINAYTRLRYQVSVYRTIGPLVFSISKKQVSPDSTQLSTNQLPLNISFSD